MTDELDTYFFDNIYDILECYCKEEDLDSACIELYKLFEVYNIDIGGKLLDAVESYI